MSYLDRSSFPWIYCHTYTCSFQECLYTLLHFCKDYWHIRWHLEIKESRIKQSLYFKLVDFAFSLFAKARMVTPNPKSLRSCPFNLFSICFQFRLSYWPKHVSLRYLVAGYIIGTVQSSTLTDVTVLLQPTDLPNTWVTWYFVHLVSIAYRLSRSFTNLRHSSCPCSLQDIYSCNFQQS